MRRTMLVLAAVLQPTLAGATDLTVTKTATVVNDPVGSVAPKSLPGAEVDYTVLFTNPLGNLGQPVRNITITDTLPVNVILRVSDIASAGKGPIEFLDGSVLGIGGSGLTCTFVSLASTSDCVDFSTDGATWTYVPVPDAAGYDANVRAIRVRPATTFNTSGSFQLRYRVRIK
ncbi:MAG: hypothetical protein J0I47_14025 [Sphingomonas sp.]|uniref:hypothetical protein n=1 Tax=Sphingomonas sp. TaxID=28214 RepID=UPI001AC5E54A|nr:hypothetical protein [Sphingomonas sp.]MBN8809336.1 hypothetical protein [Sphingomonas sp.]